MGRVITVTVLTTGMLFASQAAHAAPPCRRVQLQIGESLAAQFDTGGETVTGAEGIGPMQQVKTPPAFPGEKTWLIAGKIEGGTLDGQVAVWRRSRQKGSKFDSFGAVNDAALGAMGLTDPEFSDFESQDLPQYDKVVACVA